jgi:hypothetical protein
MPAGAQFAPGELDDYSPSEAPPPDEPSGPSDRQTADEPGSTAEPADEVIAREMDDRADESGPDRSAYAPPPPPPSPPSPPPPATQTCPDGSVVPGSAGCPGQPPPLSPQEPANLAYGYVLVAGVGVNEFYYVRQDHFNRLNGANRFEKLRSVMSYDAFGPHPAGSQVRIRHRANYYFFPVCNYQLSWLQRGFASVPEGISKPRIELKCL